MNINEEIYEVQFKVKPYKVICGDETQLRIQIPRLTKKHILNPHIFRNGKRQNEFMFNSDFFEGILNGTIKKLFNMNYDYPIVIKLNELPEFVNVDSSKFLHVVTIRI